MVWLRLGSIGVTLGGLLTLGGLAYVVTGNLSISYPRMDVALAVNNPVLHIFSFRSLVALAAFLVAAFFMARTRVGRDVYATGSDRRAAMVAGVQHLRDHSRGICVLGNARRARRIAFELQLGGGFWRGVYQCAGAGDGGGDHRRCIADGRQGHADRHRSAACWCFVCSAPGLNAVGTPPAVQDVVTGGVLFLVAIADAVDLDPRLFAIRRYFAELFFRRDDLGRLARSVAGRVDFANRKRRGAVRCAASDSRSS